MESSPQQIPYHIQVNICFDITLALSFLHSNGIVHRDLSSNNVLLIGNMRAKVTDFGMARLGDQNPQATQLTFTMCPGTDVYMPPEAVKDKPVYTDKIDCFSFGVIAIQIVTRQFPNPGDRRKEIQFNQPGLPPIVEVPVPELERRQNHIGEIDPNHPLKQVALNCLKDRDAERPSAQQLCERVAALKEDPWYSESVRVFEARSTAEQDRSDERDRELRSLRQQHSQQIQGLQQIIQSQIRRLAEKDQTIARKEETIAQNEETIAELRERTQRSGEKERELIEKIEEIDRLERQLWRVNQHLEESERANAQFLRQIAEFDIWPGIDKSSSSKEQRASIKLTWREGEEAPREMSKSYCAAADDTALYVRLTVTNRMFCYSISTSRWSRLPSCPTESCPSVIINNLFTFVGGLDRSHNITNQLFSLTGKDIDVRRWTEEFPPMPTKRQGSTALCTGITLIVVGGENNNRSLVPLRIVEVLNTKTLQWSTVADFPQPVCRAPASVCGDKLYIILGESNMYTCSLQPLVKSKKSVLLQAYRFVLGGTRATSWKKVAAPPVTESTCVSIHGRLLAVGGVDSDGKPTSAVHMYNPTTDSWEVISHMGTPRYSCIAAVLPNNQLMVVGGYVGSVSTNSVEFASIEK